MQRVQYPINVKAHLRSHQTNLEFLLKQLLKRHHGVQLTIVQGRRGVGGKEDKWEKASTLIQKQQSVLIITFFASNLLSSSSKLWISITRKSIIERLNNKILSCILPTSYHKDFEFCLKLHTSQTYFYAEGNNLKGRTRHEEKKGKYKFSCSHYRYAISYHVSSFIFKNSLDKSLFYEINKAPRVSIIYYSCFLSIYTFILEKSIYVSFANDFSASRNVLKGRERGMNAQCFRKNI